MNNNSSDGKLGKNINQSYSGSVNQADSASLAKAKKKTKREKLQTTKLGQWYIAGGDDGSEDDGADNE